MIKIQPRIKNVLSFYNDPLSFLLSKSQEPVVSFSMAHLRFHHVSGLDEIQQVLVQDQNNFVKTPQAQHYTSMALGKGLVSTDGEEWLLKRKEANPHFSAKEIDGLVQVLVKEANVLFDDMECNKPLVLNDLMMKVCLKLISKLCFGYSDSSDVGPIGIAMEEMIIETYKRIIAPFSLPTFIPTQSNLRFNRFRREYDTRIKAMTKISLANKGCKALAVKYLNGNERIGDEQVDRISMALKTIVAAGHETTATTLTWLLYEVGKNVEVGERLKNELRKVNLEALRGIGELLKQTKYTQQIINETLRLFPPIWLMGRMAVNSIMIGNKLFKKNDNVLISPFVVHRLKKHWNEPHKFNPNRFEDKALSFNKTGFFPFGLGPRKCIGQHLAIVEMIVVLATFYQRYDPVISSLKKIDYNPYITLRPSAKIMLNLKPIGI